MTPPGSKGSRPARSLQRASSASKGPGQGQGAARGMGRMRQARLECSSVCSAQACAKSAAFAAQRVCASMRQERRARSYAQWVGTFSCVPRRTVAFDCMCWKTLEEPFDAVVHGRWLKSRKRLLPCKGCAASVLRFASVAREPSRVPWRARLNSTFGFGARAATRAAQAHRASELAGRRARLEHTANFARTPSARRSLRATSACAA